MMTRRAFTASGIAAGLTAATPLGAERPAPHPVVVELFTSQGCSSCPPADALLGELSARAGILALSFHVDYWDRLGWRDPFGHASHTLRQRGYAARLRQNTLYTPQMVIDGVASVVGSRRGEVEAVIRGRMDRGPAERVSIPIGFGRRSDGAVTVMVPAATTTGPADLWLLAIDAEHATPIPRGENAGRTLVGHNVVRSLARLGRWNGDELAVTAGPETRHPGADGLVVLLQGVDFGPIWGARAVPL